MKRLSFITQFKIEFLLTFTCCRKVYEKMPYIPVSRASFSKNMKTEIFSNITEYSVIIIFTQRTRIS